MGFLKHPLPIFVISFAVLSLASWIGTVQRRRRQERDVREYGIVETFDAGRLCLVIAFTFSMAVARFDQRAERRCAALFRKFRV